MNTLVKWERKKFKMDDIPIWSTKLIIERCYNIWTESNALVKQKEFVTDSWTDKWIKNILLVTL
jgi:hypothetical protein